MKLHKSVSSAEKAVALPTYKSHSIISEDFVQTVHVIPEIFHNIPIAAGVTILEMSKLFMYDFWYNKIMKIPKCSIELGMTDTDSFLFKVTEPKIFWKEISKYMDFSNYPPDHELYSLDNKSKLGFFKDELCGIKSCKEFIGLRSKCYAMDLVNKQTNDNEEKKSL